LDLALIRFVDWLGDCFRFGMIRVGVLLVVGCWLLVGGVAYKSLFVCLQVVVVPGRRRRRFVGCLVLAGKCWVALPTQHLRTILRLTG